MGKFYFYAQNSSDTIIIQYNGTQIIFNQKKTQNHPKFFLKNTFYKTSNCSDFFSFLKLINKKHFLFKLKQKIFM